jgi:catechol 2,3-dioxygenase-like lactoylglutathione lyase family enzyme
MKALLQVVILPVSDPNRSLQFYQDQVGFDPDGNAWVLQDRNHQPT